MPHNNAPLLSVLIPTKDRYETLIPVVSQIVSRIGDERLEIVICDNSAAQRKEEIDRLQKTDPRISYHYVDVDISIVDNTERGIALCRGEYLCFIGDDDLVSPQIMRIVEWLKGQDVDCLIYPPARYWWSTVNFARANRYQHPGAFWLPKAHGGAIRWLESRAELEKVLDRGGVAYMNLPRLYHGIASRASVERIRHTFGRFVPGSSPDMALSVALALTNRRYLSVDYPVTVFGASRNSGGGKTAASRHYGRIEDQKHLPRGIAARWDPRLPMIWSEQIIYPQTIHEVMSVSRSDMRISYSALYASLIAYEPHIFRRLRPVLANYIAEDARRLPKLIARVVIKILGRMRTNFRQATGIGMPFTLRTFPDIAAVMAFMEQLPPPELPHA